MIFHKPQLNLIRYFFCLMLLVSACLGAETAFLMGED
ncbi:MAG: hypothetical protein ACD_39C00199G0004, partial [uncultured bacterium]